MTLDRPTHVSVPGDPIRNVILLAIAAFITTPVDAQTGFLDRTITTDGESFRYQVYVPSDYTPSKTWPVIVSLHGNGRQGSDGMLQTGTDFAIHIRENRAPFPAIVVFPQAKRGTRWFYPQMQQLVMAELDRTIAEFRVDTTRLYLHGYSMAAAVAIASPINSLIYSRLSSLLPAAWSPV